MPDSAPQSPAEQILALGEQARRTIAARGNALRLPGPLLVLIWNHIGVLVRAIAALATRIAEGKYKPRAYHPRAIPPAPATPPALATPAPAKPRAKRLLPSGHGWCHKLIQEVCFTAGHLEILMREPEWQAMIEASPQMRRLLRPLCMMLGVRRAAMPALPPRRTPAKPRPKKPRRDRPARVKVKPPPFWPTSLRIFPARPRRPP